MNLKELLDYSDGNNIGNRLTKISDDKLGYRLCDWNTDLLLDPRYSVNEKFYLANSYYSVDNLLGNLFKFSIDDLFYIFSLSSKYYLYGIDDEVDKSTGELLYSSVYELNNYWKFIISKYHDNASFNSTDGVINSVLISSSHINDGSIIKGKLSGAFCCAIDNHGKSQDSSGTIGSIIGAIIGALVGGFIGGLFGKIPPPSNSCMSGISFLGVQYYLRPFIENNTPMIKFSIYFKSDSSLNYSPFVMTYCHNEDEEGSRPGHELYKDNVNNLSGTLKLLNKLDYKKFNKYKLVGAKYSDKRSSSGLFKKSKTYHGNSYVTLFIGYVKTELGNQVIILLGPEASGTIRRFYTSNVYTILDKNAVLNSITNNSELYNEVDNKMIDSHVSGCSSYITNVPLDAINDAHLSRKKYRGEFEELPNDIYSIFPQLELNHVVSVGNVKYYCSSISGDVPNWELLDSSESCSVELIDVNNLG